MTIQQKWCFRVKDEENKSNQPKNWLKASICRTMCSSYSWESTDEGGGFRGGWFQREFSSRVVKKTTEMYKAHVTHGLHPRSSTARP